MKRLVRRIVTITQCIYCPYTDNGFYCNKRRREISFKERGERGRRLYLIPSWCPLPKPNDKAHSCRVGKVKEA
jgi:hypothetical protein